MSDRVDFFFRQALRQSELDLAFDQMEAAITTVVRAQAMFGICSGMVLSQRSPVADLRVAVSIGSAFDQIAQHVAIPIANSVDISTDSANSSTAVAVVGNKRYVSVYVRFKRTLSDVRTDGNAVDVFFLKLEDYEFVIDSGIEAPVPLPPVLRTDAILLGDVLLVPGQTQVLTTDISTARRQTVVNLTSSAPRTIQRGNFLDAISDLLLYYNAHVSGVADRHAGTLVDLVAGPDWPDAVTNPAGSVQARVDKTITDLGGTAGALKIRSTAITDQGTKTLLPDSVHGQLSQLLAHHNAHYGESNAHAAAAITYAGHPTGWADTVAHTTTSVEGELDKIVGDLGGSGGAARIGSASIPGSPDSLTAGSVRSQLSELLTLVNAGGGGGGGPASDAVDVNVAARTAWLNALVTNPISNAQAAFDKIITDLSSQVPATAGAKNIGTTTTGAFLVGGGVLAGSVQSTFDGIVAFLAETDGGATGFAGTERIGAKDQTAGGFSVTSASIHGQINQLLVHLGTVSGGGANATSLQGTAISTSPPSVVGQVLKWNGTQWAPGTDATGGGGSALDVRQSSAAVNAAATILDFFLNVPGTPSPALVTNQGAGIAKVEVPPTVGDNSGTAGANGGTGFANIISNTLWDNPSRSVRIYAKRLRAGANITVLDNGTDITISGSAGGPGGGVSNVINDDTTIAITTAGTVKGVKVNQNSSFSWSQQHTFGATATFNNGINLGGGFLLMGQNALYPNPAIAVQAQTSYIAINAPGPIANRYNALLDRLDAQLMDRTAGFRAALGVGAEGNTNIGGGTNFRIPYFAAPGSVSFFATITSGNVGAPVTTALTAFGVGLALPITVPGGQHFWYGHVVTQ